MVRILGIDPAQHMGWVLLEDDKYITGGVKNFTPPSKSQISKNKKVRSQKWIDIQDWLVSSIEEHAPDFIAFELVKRHTSTLAGHSYGFLKYSIGCAANRAGIEAYPIDVGKWRRIALDHGNFTKEQTSYALSLIYPSITFESDDHSDALGIALAAYRIHQKGELANLWESATGKKKKKTPDDDKT